MLASGNFIFIARLFSSKEGFLGRFTPGDSLEEATGAKTRYGIDENAISERPELLSLCAG